MEIGQLHMYMCIDVYFPPFWAYVSSINLSIRTANSKNVLGMDLSPSVLIKD
jgi:hypothetical protein